jgi:murein DD-endopeptidase MepM/ murein hydrolase activator NlpD
MTPQPRLILLFVLLAFIASCGDGQSKRFGLSLKPPKDTALVAFGFDLNEFQVRKGKVNQGELLSDILQKYQVAYPDIHQLVENARDTFDVRKIRAGNDFLVLFDKDSAGVAQYLIYEKDNEEYVVFCLQDSLYAYCGKKPVEFRQKEISGTITSSLYEALTDQGSSGELAMKMADLYAWTIDFYRIQKGDGFRVIFEEKLIDGESVEAGKILAASFNHKGENYYAFFYDLDSIGNYFDEKGNSLKKAFLKAPLKFSRISSRYSKQRFHPVLKKYKAHLGTDYAAPHGTPILAVGDGVVSKSGFTNGNGNYVKIKHNATYETQYLHMSKRAVKEGERVRQGDVIGYVGSTGLATGPHVCFRFWKNGEQVDHLAEKFPASNPIPDNEKAQYEPFVRSWMKRLDGIISNGVSPIDSTREEHVNSEP